MEAAEKFELEIVFSHLNFLLSKKSLVLSDNSLYYLDKSISFFDKLIRSIDSLNFTSNTSPSEINYYSFFPSLKEVVSNAPNVPAILLKGDLDPIKQYFSNVIIEINKLKSNPKKFYESKKYRELLILSESIKSIYSEKFYSYSFEAEETFNNVSILC